MDAIDQRLLNNYQHTFPLTKKPFDQLAQELQIRQDNILLRLHNFQDSGVISRIGPVFRPNTIGASTLAAISVPPHELQAIAAIINQFEQVNHNYEREHEINLWFVLTANCATELADTISQIQQLSGHYVLVFPLEKEYHIDLGFNMPHLKHANRIQENNPKAPANDLSWENIDKLDSFQTLIEETQKGLALVERPYLQIAKAIKRKESEVIEGLQQLINHHVIRRFGVIVRHQEMGYLANAMVVWDIKDNEVDKIGEMMGKEACVTLCYRRPRILPNWPYNLFCMIHGLNRDDVRQCINELIIKHKLIDTPHDILFSGKRFKQRGARYTRQHNITSKIPAHG